MKKVELLTTKEEIEKYGFIYEPDKSKCKSVRTAIIYTTFTVNDGILKVYPPVWECDTISGRNEVTVTKDQYMEGLASRTHGMGFEYVNSFWAEIPESIDDLHMDSKNYHGHPNITVTGHRKI